MDGFMEKKTRYKKLLAGIQHVSQKTDSQPFTEELVQSLQEYTADLSTLFQISHTEAILLSYFINCHLHDIRVEKEDFVNHFGKDISAMAEIDEIVESLAQKKLIYLSGVDRKYKYLYKSASLNPKVMVVLAEGENTILSTKGAECFQDFLYDIAELYRQRNMTQTSNAELLAEIQGLMQASKSLPEIQWLLNQVSLKDIDLLFFLRVCIEQLEGEDEVDLDSVLKDTFLHASDRAKFKLAIKANKSCLLRDGYIIHAGTLFSWPNTIQLSDESIEQLFGEAREYVSNPFSSKVGHFIEYQRIEKEVLYYNPREKKQLDTLFAALQHDQYQHLTTQLQENKLPAGFTVLFYGYPGTGKTATVKALAKATNRHIFMVDIPMINSKWVGESEKNISKIFEDYKKARSRFSVDPILLFNEADAILGKRIGTGSSVDKMHNALQNILLQELEDFEGIFIATTNLASHLDMAFERRLLYKIEFKKPEPEVRASILQAAFNGIDPKILCELNFQYDLTGGQIANMRKKLLVESLLNQQIDKEKALIHFCEEEFVLRAKSTSVIGFIQ